MGNFGFMTGQVGNIGDTSERFPIVQWYNYQPTAKSLGKDHPVYTGGFFFKAEQDENFPVGDRLEYNYAGGSSNDVFAIGAARIAILAGRVDWYLGDKNSKPTWLDHYEEGARGRNRFLVVMEGAEAWHADNGPLMLSLYGVNGLLMAKAHQEFMNKVHKPAEKLAGQKLDAYTFYMSIVPGAPEKANPNFTTMITPPRLDVSALEKKGANLGAFLEDAFIGASAMAMCADLWSKAQEWKQNPMNSNAKQDGLMPEAYGDPNPADTEEVGGGLPFSIDGDAK